MPDRIGSEPLATHATRAGAVDLGSGHKQHVDLFRKLRLRRALLEKIGPGGAYVPFLGEADIAAELYTDRPIYGVELDPEIAERGATRIRALHPDSGVLVGDAERGWYDPPAISEPYAILDIDAYSNPYVALEVAWRALDAGETPARRLADRVAIFGTDGMRLAIRRSKTRMIGPLPVGVPLLKTDDINERRRQWNTWYEATVLPYLTELVAPAVIVEDTKYLRDHMLYWGVVVDRTGSSTRSDLESDESPTTRTAPASPTMAPSSSSAATPDDIAAVENALLEAARSGNVPAAIFWLEHKGGKTWRGSGRSRLDEIVEEHER